MRQLFGTLRKGSMPLKNSLPEAFSALILVFSNQDGEYLGSPQKTDDRAR